VRSGCDQEHRRDLFLRRFAASEWRIGDVDAGEADQRRSDSLAGFIGTGDETRGEVNVFDRETVKTKESIDELKRRMSLVSQEAREIEARAEAQSSN